MLDLIVGWSSHWGYLGVALGMALESACVPLPSEVILPFAGYLVSLGKLTFLGAVLAGWLGGLAGSLAAFAVGYWGGRPLAERYGQAFWLGRQELARAEAWVTRYGEHAAFWSRLLPGVRTFISLPLGMSRMRLGRFVVFSALGSLPWTVALVYAGYALGAHWQALRPLFHRLDALLAIVLLVALIGWWRARRRTH